MWAIDATQVTTVQDGKIWLFGAVEPLKFALTAASAIMAQAVMVPVTALAGVRVGA